MPDSLQRLSLTEIGKRFGGIVALRGASLSAGAGEIVGLVGENGAGKSTLLKILAGVYPAGSFTGAITIDGAPAHFSSTRDAEQKGISIVHQELQLAGDLSVAENLCLGVEPGRFGFVDRARVLADARALLARFDASEVDPDALISTLGVGVQQKVEVIRALSKKTRVLILDEPTAALSHTEAEKLLAWLRTLVKTGTTCLYVSHHLDEVLSLCDRVVVLRDGATVADRVTATLTAPALTELIVGHQLQDRRPTPVAISAAPIFRARDVTLAGIRPVLSSMSLSVAAGEVVGIAGALGAGRSALLRTLFGAAHGDRAGTLELDSQMFALADFSPERAVKVGIAFVPEDRKGAGVLLDLSIAENVALGSDGRTAGVVRDENYDEVRAQKTIKSLSIRGSAAQTVSTLSGGNQQKVAVGKWLDPMPRVLIVDEPTRGVDVGAKEEIYAIVEALKAKGVAVLVASSDVPELVRLCDRVLLMSKGNLVGELVHAAITQPALEHFVTTGALA